MSEFALSRRLSIAVSPGSARVRVLNSLRGDDSSLSPPTDYAGKNRDEDHEKYDNLDVLIDARNISSQEIAGEQHAPYPEKGAEHADRKENAVWHPRCAGDNRGECSDDWHELSEDNGLPTMLLIELFGAQQMLFLEQERVVAREKSRTCAPPDEISGGIAEDCRDMKNCAEQVDIQQSASRNEAGCYEEGIARKKKTDEQAGFREDDAGHTEVARPFYQSGKVGEIREQLTQLIH